MLTQSLLHFKAAGAVWNMGSDSRAQAAERDHVTASPTRQAPAMPIAHRVNPQTSTSPSTVHRPRPPRPWPRQLPASWPPLPPSLPPSLSSPTISPTRTSTRPSSTRARSRLAPQPSPRSSCTATSLASPCYGVPGAVPKRHAKMSH